MDLIKEEIAKLISSDKFPEINDEYKKYVTERVLENQIKFLKEASADSATQTSGVQNWEPVLIRMVRRSMPQLMAFPLSGVQPMNAPTTSIFAMRSRYTSQTGTEALFDEANSAFSGTGSQAGDTSGFAKGYFDNTSGSEVPLVSTASGTGMSTTTAEALGASGSAWNEMTFSIERVDVSAKSRKLKASFSRELQYDLKQIHGLDAETELANILSTEITAEQDRELLRTINVSAVIGAQNATTPGRFDLATDSDGRWLVENFKGLIFQLELEANAVSTSTRRGRANRVICSSNVASALNMAGVLSYGPFPGTNLNIDPSVSNFAGVLLGRYQVFIDPYAAVDYVTVGYKGENAWDAGVYFCPYVPLEMVRSTGEDSFQPKIGFSSRYGLVANPFVSTKADGTVKPGKGLGQGENNYFRKFQVTNLQG